jgi:hypothetical protein
MALLKITNKDKNNNITERIIYNNSTQYEINPSEYGGSVMCGLFKYDFKHDSLPPTLVTLSDKKYLMPLWVEVHPMTTLEDINWIKPKLKTAIEKIKVKSTDKTYTVTKYTQDGKTEYRCNCRGYFRLLDKKQGCKHINEIKQ